MKLTTTVIGSYPYARLAPADAIKRAVTDQVEAGIDVISDGQVRADMVALFVKGIPGFDLQGRKYNVVSKITPPAAPISLDDLLEAKKSVTGQAKLKGIITGPTTIANCSIIQGSCPYHPHQMPEGSRSMVVDENLVMDIARALAEEARFLSNEGFDIIQIDEPFFSMPDVDVDLGNRALKIISANIGFSALHVCGDITGVMDKLMDAPVDMVAVEGGHAASVDWLTKEKVDAKGKKICWGAVTVNTNNVEQIDEIKARIQVGVDKVGAENLWVSPDCGMRVRKPDAAKLKLQRMAAAARAVAKSCG